MPDFNEDLVRVARIGKPHGIRGEVTVEVFTDSPETRFANGNILVLEPKPSSGPEVLTIEKSRWNKKILLLKFAEFSDRNTAEALRDTGLYASPVDPLEEEPGWYADELLGFAVYDSNAALPPIGKVSDLITGSAQDLLEVELNDGRKVLIPFVEEIVPEINESRGAVIITPPPGLLELNQD